MILPALAAFVLAGLAHASMGGPQLAELLGWDERDSKVFFRVTYVDESGQPPGIFYFDLRGHDPARLVRVSWSKQVRDESLYEAKVASLRRRLRPLEEALAPTIPVGSTVLAVDTLRNIYGPWPRYRVRVRDSQCLGYAVLDVTTIGDPCVRVIRQWTVPGRRGRVAVISFRALPYEMGYEVQVPVLLPSERHGTLTVEVPSREQ